MLTQQRPLFKRILLPWVHDVGSMTRYVDSGSLHGALLEGELVATFPRAMR